MAFNFKNLEEYFKASEKNKQPVGTSVDPLGKFAPKPIQQQFNRAIDFPTQKPNAPFIFIPGYSTSKLAELVKGKEIEGRDKAFSLEGQAFDPRDKAFSKKGPDFTTQKINTQQGQIDYTTQAINTQKNQVEYSTQEPISPLGQTPDKSTLGPINPMASTPEKSTIDPVAFGPTPDKSTQGPVNPMAQTPEKSTLSPVNPMATTPEKPSALLELFAGLSPSDRKPIFAAQGTPKITHMNNMTSGFLEIGDQPDKRDGTTLFKFSQTPPAGGSSNLFTRQRYNDYFARIKPAARQGASIAAGTEGNPPSLRMSGGQIDDFQTRVGPNDFVNLRDEAQRNNPRSPLFGKQPFIQRGIQKGPGNENPSSPGFLPSLDPVDGAIGMITSPLIDTARIAKFMVSPRGLLFNIKQFGLQLTNPKKQFFQLPFVNADRIYNPLALALQVPLNALGIHGDRHFLGQLNPRDIMYERVVDTIENKNPSSPGDSNRLVKLGEDMEVGLFKNPVKELIPQKLKGLEALYTKFTKFLNKLKGRGEKIGRLSGIAGPNSLFGIGQTQIFKHTSGISYDRVFIYTPEEPYYKQKATTHYDDGKISEASKGEDNEDLSLGILTFKGDNGYEPYEQDAPDSWKGFPKAEGDIDPAGVNPGKYKTKDYSAIHDKFGNDAGDDKYGNPDLESFDQSKFGTDDDTKGAPKATKNTEDELFIKQPANSGEIFPGSGDKEFSVFSYVDLGNHRRNPKTFRDFRKKDDGDSYEKNSVKRIKLSDYGATKPGESADDTNYGKDYVSISIGGIKLRAYITEISDALKPTYSSISYAGNPVDAYMFDKISREWSLGLQMPAFTQGELKNNYKLLNQIMQKASPEMFSDVGGGRINNITVGNLWQAVPSIIETVDYTINLDAGWDIALGEGNETTSLELPMLFDLKIGGKFLVNADGKIWKSDGKFISY